MILITLNQYIKENLNKDLIFVDIQPEYQDYFNFTSQWIYFLNNNYLNYNITLLYNGQELGMITEGEYVMWLFENGLEEDALNYIEFYDKGYAFFRYCIDNGIDDDLTVNLIKFMISEGITDSRDIDEGTWDKFISKHDDSQEIRELLEHSSDLIYIPYLMDLLKNNSNITLAGGGIDECLREVEIALKALNKKYDLMDSFIY